MDRVAGLETEYGCLVSGEEGRGQTDAWPAKVKNFLFGTDKAGAIDLHYRDYEEPPGNGGFLLNGGRMEFRFDQFDLRTSSASKTVLSSNRRLGPAERIRTPTSEK